MNFKPELPPETRESIKAAIRQSDSERAANKLSNDEMIEQLISAGWRNKASAIWASPEGKLFLGPYGAWKAMAQAKTHHAPYPTPNG